MNKAVIKNLIRQTYNDLASKNNDPIGKYGAHGVNILLAQAYFLAYPSPKTAVDIVVEQLKAELAKLQSKEIPREKWPRFFQDEQWVKKTYQRYGLSYPGNKFDIEPIQNNPTLQDATMEETFQRNEVKKESAYFDNPYKNDGYGTITEMKQDKYER